MAPSIPPAFMCLCRLCVCVWKATVLEVPVLCHPEGKVHITQTGSKGPAQEKNMKTTSKEERAAWGAGQGEGKNPCCTQAPGA